MPSLNMRSGTDAAALCCASTIASMPAKSATPNTADYFGRGWCFCESSVAHLGKPFSGMVMDLGKITADEVGAQGQSAVPALWDVLLKQCTADAPPPLLVDDFAAALEQKAFTSNNADLPLVAGIYKSAF